MTESQIVLICGWKFEARGLFLNLVVEEAEGVKGERRFSRVHFLVMMHTVAPDPNLGPIREMFSRWEVNAFLRHDHLDDSMGESPQPETLSEHAIHPGEL